MSFFRTIADCLRKYVSVEGVANRREFWFWILFAVIVLGIANIIDGVVIGPARGFLPFEHEAGTPLSIAMFLALVPPTITAAVRRLHDSEYSGWWLLIGLTVIGLVPLFYFLIKSGKKGKNRFSHS